MRRAEAAPGVPTAEKAALTWPASGRCHYRRTWGQGQISGRALAPQLGPSCRKGPFCAPVSPGARCGCPILCSDEVSQVPSHSVSDCKEDRATTVALGV